MTTINEKWKVKLTRTNGLWKGYAEKPTTRILNGKKRPDTAMAVTIEYTDLTDCINELEKHVSFLEEA